MVTISKFSYENPRFINLLKRRSSIPEEEFAQAEGMVSEEFKEAVKKACDNLFRFHKRQLPQGFTESYENGAVLERRYTPLDSVAVTVPGNMAPALRQVQPFVCLKNRHRRFGRKSTAYVKKIIW